jgi:hypothetical protein
LGYLLKVAHYLKLFEIQWLPAAHPMAGAWFMEPRLHETREAWLNHVATRMLPIFQQLAAPLPARGDHGGYGRGRFGQKNGRNIVGIGGHGGRLWHGF